MEDVLQYIHGHGSIFLEDNKEICLRISLHPEGQVLAIRYCQVKEHFKDSTRNTSISIGSILDKRDEPDDSP